VLWSVFALFLLAKMGLFTRIWHYGFYLAMPAALFVIFLLMWVLPSELKRFKVDREIFRGLVLAFLVVALFRLEGMTNHRLAVKTLAVGNDGDAMLCIKSERLTKGVMAAVGWVGKNTTPDETLAVMPEGVIVNYLTRRTNPTPYTVFCLPEVRAYGEANMLAAYQKNSPDYIMLIHREMQEYGVGCFGSEPGYGFEMMQWVHANYTRVWLFGSEPLKTEQFGVEILKRNSQPSRDMAGLR
jgi:hypothetical protein